MCRGQKRGGEIRRYVDRRDLKRLPIGRRKYIARRAVAGVLWLLGIEPGAEAETPNNSRLDSRPDQVTVLVLTLWSELQGRHPLRTIGPSLLHDADLRSRPGLVRHHRSNIGPAHVVVEHRRAAVQPVKPRAS